MKKTLSVILALVMIMSCASVAFAVPLTGECTCDGHVDTKCRCCIFCPNFDEGVKSDCVTITVVGGERKIDACCENCNGKFTCNCAKYYDCGCADCNGESKEGDGSNDNVLLTPEQQEEFVNGFQKIIKIIADAFNKFFDAIFEFLRINEVV